MLPQLPAKRRQIIEIGTDKKLDLVAKEKGMFEKYQEALQKHFF